MIRVGPAGWSYPDWNGVVYPRRRPRSFHPLAFLARYFDCVELNSSFYGIPRADRAARWAEIVADRPRFRFTAKLAREFTHEPLPEGETELVERASTWRAGLEPLERAGRLSALLLQFPLSFRHRGSSRERLERLVEIFGDLPLVLEVRHRSWFEEEPLAAIEGLGLSLAEIDLPPASVHPPAEPPAIGAVGYLRLHGRNAAAWFDPRSGRDERYDYLYGETEIEDIARTVRRIASGRDTTFVITNNHFSGKAVANALEILARLGSEPPPAPADLLRAFPRLSTRTCAEGQGDLFRDEGVSP